MLRRDWEMAESAKGSLCKQEDLRSPQHPHKKPAWLGMVAHTFNPSTWGRCRGRCIRDFEVSLVYIVSSRPVRVT